MNFSKLSKEKRNHLIIVAVLTVVVLGALGFGLIRWQYGRLNTLASNTVSAEKRLKEVKDSIANADRIESEFTAKNSLLLQQEESMVTGDPYSWMLNTLRKFKEPYRVDIPQIGQPTAKTEVNLLVKFPYQQVAVRVGGTAYYHDIGKFLADFENRFPHIRVLNLSLDSTSSAEKEKLAFVMDIVALVKATP